MRFIDYLHNLYWNRLLGGLYGYIADLIGEEVEYEWLEPAFKGVVTLLLLVALYELYLRIYQAINNYRIRKSMSGAEVREPYTVKDASFVEELDAAQHPVHTLQQLKKEKRYDRLADIHAKLNQPAEAARWYKKSRQYERAAEELAKAGKTLQAARLLMRTGNHETAARFYSSAGKHKHAASAWRKAGDLVNAATAYAAGGFTQAAADCFQEYFTSSIDPPRKQEVAADKCYYLLQKGEFSNALPNTQRNLLFKMTAQRFLSVGRAALAARVFQEAGETRLAGEVYKRIARRQTEGVASDVRSAPANKTAPRARPDS